MSIIVSVSFEVTSTCGEVPSYSSETTPTV